MVGWAAAQTIPPADILTTASEGLNCCAGKTERASQRAVASSAPQSPWTSVLRGHGASRSSEPPHKTELDELYRGLVHAAPPATRSCDCSDVRQHYEIDALPNKEMSLWRLLAHLRVIKPSVWRFVVDTLVNVNALSEEYTYTWH